MITTITIMNPTIITVVVVDVGASGGVVVMITIKVAAIICFIRGYCRVDDWVVLGGSR